MHSLLEILNKTTAFFESKGVPNAKLDAQILLAHTLSCKRLDLFLRFDEVLSSETLDKFRLLVKRRSQREPLQHIIGFTEFFGLKLICDRRALIPRHETEELCEIITQKYFQTPPKNILDMGTGTGAIALALASFYKESEVFAADKSSDAIGLAKENAEALGLSERVKFIFSDWFENVEGAFDLIVSNPPYLTQAEYESAQDEVKKFDPISALVSPSLGIADLEKIIEALPKFLSQNGFAFFECGLSQPEKLAEKYSEHFLSTVLADSSGRMRFLVLQKK